MAIRVDWEPIKLLRCHRGPVKHALTLLTLITLGCAGEEEQAAECPPDSFLTYENYGQPFLTTWCTPCHSSHLEALEERQDAPLGVNFDSYADCYDRALWP